METFIIWSIVLYLLYILFKCLDALLEDPIVYEQKEHEWRHQQYLKSLEKKKGKRNEMQSL